MIATAREQLPLHVLEGWHRATAWDHHCQHGTAYSIKVNVVVHDAWWPT